MSKCGECDGKGKTGESYCPVCNPNGHLLDTFASECTTPNQDWRYWYDRWMKETNTLKVRVEELEDVERQGVIARRLKVQFENAIHYRTALEEIKDLLESNRDDEAVYRAVDIATTALDKGKEEE